MPHDLPVILLLAAGEGSRFGGAKQLAPIASEPMVRRMARMLLETGAPVLVVTGAYADEVEAVLDDLPLGLIRCKDWQSGMGHSLAAGVRALVRAFPSASAVFVCLADQPLLDLDMLNTMLQRHTQASERILITTQHGTQGPPALFPRDCFDALAALSGPQGARAIWQQDMSRVDLFESESLLDVDTAEDLQHVRWLLSRTKRTP
ncbi:nucleotidyltransferase family protein [Dyella nitratireducens]|uniref:MobA-like NTP transferase domain-containing protein n=1 Tax=Dyella nitratireducens TaxID=1849580 RepID=A0ABQ1G6V8_9GAMM|nr:nucleotidyltransferase family protein [Dyella nitratireducens]GGA37924.1 hypothetical protein GCM10010981_28840 [Dyella nitratireducens]GLQ40243.1 hypothetical protein GCM10007902_00920 [Dyella nitratireducens]